MHLAVTIPLIVLISALVNVARKPMELSLSVLLVLTVLALIPIGLQFILTLAPRAFPVFQPAFELSLVYTPVIPSVYALPIRFALPVLPHIPVAISEEVCALALLETLHPLAIVPVAIRPGVRAHAIRFVTLPITHIQVIWLQPFPYALA